MNTQIRKPRGLIIPPRADLTPQAVLAEIQKTFAEFRAENDARLKGVDKRFDDVVQNEKVDRINAALTEQQKLLDALNAQLASAALGAGSAVIVDPAAREHAQAFQRYFRKGVDNGLGDLQVRAGLTTTSDPDGGYLVDRATEQTIDRLLGTVSVMRQLATVMPIGVPTYRRFTNAGGTTSGWVGENESRTETDTPDLKEQKFEMMELYAYPFTTQVMLDDGIVDIAAWLANEVATEFDEEEGAAFVTGNGFKRPRGFTDYDKVANASWEWGKLGFIVSGGASDFASSSPGDAFISLYYALKQGYRAGASWLMSDATMASIRKFKDGQGNYLWAAPTAAAQVPTILNRPVYTDDNMPAVGSNTYPVAFGDFRRAYMIFDRVGIRVIRNPYASMGKIGFYTTKRVGGGVANFQALKLMKIST